MLAYNQMLVAILLAASTDAHTTEHESVPSENLTGGHSAHGSQGACSRGTLLPVWMPDPPAYEDRYGRALVYFVFFAYSFLGMSIIMDDFVEAVEVRCFECERVHALQVITSRQRPVTLTMPGTGKQVTIMEPVWNETVANLTLNALGAASPEILLNVIEICFNSFQACQWRAR